jgi:hypothetical protein
MWYVTHALQRSLQFGMDFKHLKMVIYSLSVITHCIILATNSWMLKWCICLKFLTSFLEHMVPSTATSGIDAMSKVED